MTRFFSRIAASIVFGWWAGVEVAALIDREANLLPLLTILPTILVVYLMSFLIVPLFTNWLDRIR